MATGAGVSIQGHKELQRRFSQLALLSRRAAADEVRAGIFLVQGQAKKLTRMAGTGREYTRGGVTHRASAPGEPPAKDQNRLGAVLASGEAITYENGGLIASFGPRNYKPALYLEFGTRNMAPRPFLFRSLEDVRPRILDGFKRAQMRVMGA